jgi:hypothetical protein
MNCKPNIAISSLLASSLAEIRGSLAQLLRAVKEPEMKKQIDHIIEQLGKLQRSASAAEEQKREPRKQVGLPGGIVFEFRAPFYYRKGTAEPPLCPDCFAKAITAPVGYPGENCPESCRSCLICEKLYPIPAKAGEQEAGWEIPVRGSC